MGDILGAALNVIRGGKDKTVIRNSVHVDVLTAATMSAISQCTLDADLSQIVHIQCTADASATRGCNACLDAVQKMSTQRAVLELEAGGAGERSDWPSTAACDVACASCIVRDVTQSMTAQLKTTCNVYNDFDTHIKHQIQTAVEQTYQSQEDALASISKIFSGPQKQTMINDYAGALRNVVTKEFANALRSAIIAHQTIRIGQKSVIVQHVNQTINTSMVFSLIAQTKVQDRVYTLQQIAAAQAYLEQNTTIVDAIDALGGAAVSGIDLMSSTMGLIMIIATVMLVAALVVMFLVYQMNPALVSAVGAAVEQRAMAKLAT